MRTHTRLFQYLFYACVSAGWQCTPQSQLLRQAPTAGKIYYLSSTGDDLGVGDARHPWKSLSRVNALALQAGDTVYLAGGQTFAGTLELDKADGGTAKQPVVITAWGRGKAILEAGNQAAITVNGSRHVLIKGVKLVGSGRKTGNTQSGLSIQQSQFITVDSVETQGFQKSGLGIYRSSNLSINRVYAHDNGAAGISVDGSNDKTENQHIYIGYCTAENNPGDPTNLTNHSGNGIVVGMCRRVTIDHCVATNNGWDMPRKGNGPVGIWAWEADSVIIQHCLSYQNKTSPGGGDGGGFDLDGGVTHSIIQYCLSYGNQGSGFGIFQYQGASPWYDNTIRFNISENDDGNGTAGGSVFIWNQTRDSTQFKNCFFYNNVIYNTGGAAISLPVEREKQQFHFYNNIFVAKDTLIKGDLTNELFRGNVWWTVSRRFILSGFTDLNAWIRHTGQETWHGKVVGIQAAPAFNAPGKANLKAAAELPAWTNYELRSDVPKFRGINLQKQVGIAPGGVDFKGRPASAMGIGACL